MQLATPRRLWRVSGQLATGKTVAAFRRWVGLMANQQALLGTEEIQLRAIQLGNIGLTGADKTTHVLQALQAQAEDIRRIRWQRATLVALGQIAEQQAE